MHGIKIPQSQIIAFNKQISLLSISRLPQKETTESDIQNRPIRIMKPRKRFRHHCLIILPPLFTNIYLESSFTPKKKKNLS